MHSLKSVFSALCLENELWEHCSLRRLRRGDFSVYCNYTQFMSFFASMKKKNGSHYWVAFYTVHPIKGPEQISRYSDSLHLDGPGIESLRGEHFPHPSRPVLGVHPAIYTRGTGSFPGVKRPELSLDHSPLSSATVKERVELYLYSPLGLRGLF